MRSMPFFRVLDGAGHEGRRLRSGGGMGVHLRSQNRRARAIAVAKRQNWGVGQWLGEIQTG